LPGVGLHADRTRGETGLKHGHLKKKGRPRGKGSGWNRQFNLGEVRAYIGIKHWGQD